MLLERNGFHLDVENIHESAKIISFSIIN